MLFCMYARYGCISNICYLASLRFEMLNIITSEGAPLDMDHLALGHLGLSSPEFWRIMPIRKGIVCIEYLDSIMKHLFANQCKERSQITPLNLYSWFRYNCWWVYLMAIEDKLVWVVGHCHLHTWVEGVENFSNHPTNYERLHGSRHGWNKRYWYFAQQMLSLNAASYWKDALRTAYWALVEDKSLFIVVWSLLPSVGSKRMGACVVF
jgi:hypothetical protein